MVIEDGVTEEKVAFLHKNDKLELQPQNPTKKGGLRTMPFIFGTHFCSFSCNLSFWISNPPTPNFQRKFTPFLWAVNESFERMASSGLLPNMILYLINGYHLEAASGSVILSLWNAASNTMAIFGAFLSDSYLGRFRVIALGTCSSLVVSQFLKFS